MIILLDNGHSFDTPGKCSPDGFFREYAYNRYLAFRIREQFSALGLDAQLLVPEREDISLPERCRLLARGTKNPINLPQKLRSICPKNSGQFATKTPITFCISRNVAYLYLRNKRLAI